MIQFEEKLKEILGEEWMHFLPRAAEILEPIAQIISTERTIMRIQPESSKVFRAFEMRPSQIKVVWLGMDPYHWPPGQASGLSFDCGRMASPSWTKISKVYEQDVDSPDPKVMNGRLDKWTQEGVFLINSALTVREKIPGSHIKLWEPFTKYLISCLLTDFKPKAFVVLGEKARNVVPRVGSPHKGFYYEHPAAASYRGDDWDAKGIFKEINKFIQFHYNQSINW